jgi:hypothetical protein
MNHVAMKISICGLIAVTMLCLVIAGGTARADWEKIFAGNGVTQGLSVQQTSDGGFIITGHTAVDSASNTDVFLIKTDSAGNRTWSKIFGGSGIDMAYCVRLTADGGYIVAGATQPSGQVDFDVYLIKTDSAGNLQWSRTFGDSGDDYGYSVRQTYDGGYILAGRSQKVPVTSVTDAYLVKTDHLGNETWSKTFDAHQQAHFADIQPTTDGGYIAVGAAEDSGTGYVYAVKTDTAGTATWSQTFANSRYDFTQTVNQASDGGLVFSATTEDHHARIIKADSGGNLEWSRVFNVPGAFATTCQAAIQTRDNGYALIGTIAETSYDLDSCENGSGGDTDAYLLKTDAAGNETWRKIFDTDSCEEFAALQQTVDGLYVVTGGQANSALLIGTSGGPTGPRPGDVDGNGLIYLNDAILAMQILTGSGSGDARADVSNDKQIGLEEIIYITQAVAGLR